jgi:hypothetical protein
MDGYPENILRLYYFLCEDSSCQKHKMFSGFQIGNLNYIKILITDPNLEGRILVDEMSYSLNSENHFFIRPIVPKKMFNHHYS